MAVAVTGFSPASVHLSVHPHNISISAVARITKLDVEIFHYKRWKPDLFWDKRPKVVVTRHKKTVPACFFAFLWVLASCIVPLVCSIHSQHIFVPCSALCQEAEPEEAIARFVVRQKNTVNISLSMRTSKLRAFKLSLKRDDESLQHIVSWHLKWLKPQPGFTFFNHLWARLSAGRAHA